MQGDTCLATISKETGYERDFCNVSLFANAAKQDDS